jgi:16S rRNA processing protein RimM
MNPARLEVGRIEKAHGIRGEVSVSVSSDAPQRFAAGAILYDGERALTIKASRAHHDRMLVSFEGIQDRNAAEALRGIVLSIPAEDAAPLAEWSFYPHQLEGLEVVDASGARLGTFARVEETAASDIWVVRSGTREVLVPAVRAIVRAVDLDARRIVLDPPEGLF